MILSVKRECIGVDRRLFSALSGCALVLTGACSVCLVFLQSKIVRVLHLWQKNSVFTNDVIQQLLKMVEQEESISPVAGRVN